MIPLAWSRLPDISRIILKIFRFSIEGVSAIVLPVASQCFFILSCRWEDEFRWSGLTVALRLEREEEATKAERVT